MFPAERIVCKEDSRRTSNGRRKYTAKVRSWHEADVQRLPGSRPLTGALPTFGAECRFTVAFQTQRQVVPKVAV